MVIYFWGHTVILKTGCNASLTNQNLNVHFLYLQGLLSRETTLISAWTAENTEATTDFEISGRLTSQKKDTGISFDYQQMEKVEMAHSSYTKSMYNSPKGYINDSTAKKRKETIGNLFDDTDVLEQRHLPSFGKPQTGMACSFHVSSNGGFENTFDHAYNTEDKIAARLRGTHLPEKDNTRKSVKRTQKIIRSMVEESRTGVPVTSMASDKPDIVKDEIAKGPFYSLNAEKMPERIYSHY